MRRDISDSLHRYIVVMFLFELVIQTVLFDAMVFETLFGRDSEGHYKKQYETAACFAFVNHTILFLSRLCVDMSAERFGARCKEAMKRGAQGLIHRMRCTV